MTEQERDLVRALEVFIEATPILSSDGQCMVDDRGRPCALDVWQALKTLREIRAQPRPFRFPPTLESQ